MSVQVQVRHRVGGEHHVVAVLMRGPGGGFDPDAGGDAGQHDLGDAGPLQFGMQGGAAEGAPPLPEDADVTVLASTVESVNSVPFACEGCEIREATGVLRRLFRYDVT
jgi:hypothetical protein